MATAIRPYYFHYSVSEDIGLLYANNALEKATRFLTPRKPIDDVMGDGTTG
jgi:hypothetical protein